MDSLRFVLPAPAAKVERDSHASGAHFVRKSKVGHGASYDHAADGESSDALCRGVATRNIGAQASLGDAHHGLEYDLECRFALSPLRATSVGNATMGQEFSMSSKCWRDR
jgi:hypothetical protein